MWWLAAGLLIFFLIARKAGSARNQEKVNLSSNQTVTKNEGTEQRLTVATYNVQTGKSYAGHDKRGKRDITRAGKVICSADIVGIQEVYASTWLNRLGFGLSQTNALAQEGKFNYLFAATRRRWFREHRGNALLSRVPVNQCDITMLPDYSGKSYRNMTVAEFELNTQSCHFINTHLHTKEGRQEQLKLVIDEFLRHPRAILVGDFNSKKDEPLLKQLLSNSEVTDAIQVSGINTENQIDWIFTKGFTVVSGKAIPKGISDHPYYQVCLTLTNYDPIN